MPKSVEKGIALYKKREISKPVIGVAGFAPSEAHLATFTPHPIGGDTLFFDANSIEYQVMNGKVHDAISM